MYRGDAARRGRAAHRLPLRAPTLRWRFQAKRAVYAQPVIDGRGDVYIASLDGHVYALTAEGELRWKRRVGARIFSTPALTARGLLVGADDDALRLLDLETGQQRWRFETGPCRKLPGFGMDSVRCQVDSSPAISADGSLAYVAADALYAIALTSGKARWRAPLSGHAFASVARAADGTLVVGTKALTVVGLASSDDGRERWRFKAHDNCDATPAIAAQAPLPGPPDDPSELSRATKEETLRIRRRRVGAVAYVGCDDGRLRAFEVASGRELWSVRTHRRVESSAAIGPRGRVYFGSGDGWLRVVSPEGKLVWRFRTQGAIHAAPVVDADGAVIVGSRDDHLYALDRDGRLLWKRRFGGDVDAPVAVAKDGTLIVGCDDGTVTALR